MPRSDALCSRALSTQPHFSLIPIATEPSAETIGLRGLAVAEFSESSSRMLRYLFALAISFGLGAQRALVDVIALILLAARRAC